VSAFFTKVFAIAEGFLPQDPRFSNAFRFFNLERGIIVGLLIMVMGFGLLIRGAWIWKGVHYGVLPYADNMRRLIPAVTLLVAGIQVIFSSFFLSVLGLRTASRQPPELPETAA
jgi:hypothetical protein